MRLYILYTFLFFLKQIFAYREEHVCDFTGETKKNICEINAKPFDYVIFKCQKPIGPKCFESVSLVNDTKNPSRSVASLNLTLNGSIAFEEKVLISPSVTQESTFYCFCDLTPNEEQVEENKEKADAKKDEKKQEEEEEVVVEEPEENSEERRAIDRVRKMRGNQKPNDNILQQNDEEELVEGEENEEANQQKGNKAVAKIGVMKVTISKNDYVVKGCDFGTTFSYNFTKNFPLEKSGGSRVCKIEAAPGELVGFKCMFDSRGTVEPNGCFDKVYYNEEETALKTLMPGYASFANTNHSHYAYYLQIPHFVQSEYTIKCRCRSDNSELNNYIFEVTVRAGESNTVEQSHR